MQIIKTISKRLKANARVAGFVSLFAVVGLVFIVLSHASTPSTSVSIEPENGSKTGVTTCTDPSASNGHCIQFGSGASQFSAPATALTVVGTDDVASAAVCIDNSAAVSSLSSRVTACIQVNPADNTKARFGTYDDNNKVFYPLGNSGWTTMSDPDSADHVTSLTCSNSGHSALGLGPLNGNYYGEEKSGNNITFGTIAVSGHACQTAGGGLLSSAQWATPAIYCSTAAQAPNQLVHTLGEYSAALKSAQAEICLAPGSYSYTSAMTTLPIPASTKVIGQSPLRRPVFDSSALSPHGANNKPQRTSSFTAGGKSILLANVVAKGARGDLNGIRNGTCPNCGNGIDSGEGMHLYNVKSANNMETGFHFAVNHKGIINLYTVENSELSGNGSNGDNTWAAGGMKTINGGLIKNNVVINNNGPGLWCDGNDQNHSECHGGRWTVESNYIAGNYGDGVHFEIVFSNPTTGQSDPSANPPVTVAAVDPPWADIEHNVINCNNQHKVSWYGGVSIFAANVLVTHNIFDNRQDAAKFKHSCSDGKQQAVYVYNDARVPPYTHDVTVQNNTLNGDKLTCASGTAIICQ